MSQEDGATRFEFDGVGGVSLDSRASWPSSQIGYLQGRMKLSRYEGADHGDVHLVLRTKISSGWWQAFCYIDGIQDLLPEQANFVCPVVTTDNNQQENYEYFSDAVLINLGDWHTAKVEIDPSTFELRFYCDGKVIGRHVPKNADELRGANLRVLFGVSSNQTSRHVVGSIDDVLVARSP